MTGLVWLSEEAVEVPGVVVFLRGNVGFVNKSIFVQEDNLEPPKNAWQRSSGEWEKETGLGKALI